ncbi:HEAT repeat domain-containing protein [Leptodesmis sichuanensis]|uniref:HEAT repeat domain-containing protein n=1 Tax=Leptodesmis sichuanensis TaxID=2906798 RepID=UPI001F177817|nr:HEAT repeat domain-containing protein [Leptodesmis sichuanensis]UIE38422.1 HEAT repeat domain-containing protein [Leptodesmis sichuanensis A121]
MTPLEDLLRQCTVKITVLGGWGTGFFVAPGLILTCAHVVRKAADLQVTVVYPTRESPLLATVKAQADDRKTLDLALVELTEPLLAHPCVLLDEEAVAIGQALYSYGYLESYANAAPVHPVNEGLTGDTPPLLKLQGAQVEKGISGAALLNLKTGKVCGMVKETRAAGFDLGGGAIPTRVILEQFPELRELQQAFHRGDRRWINLITPPRIDFQLYLQAILTNEDYREWQEVYTPTTVEDRRRMPEPETTIAFQRRFSSRLKLRAEIVKLDKQEQDNQPNGVREPQERVEQWDVLAGLRNYATEHVVLIGKPGSGKSTSLERLLWEEAEKALQDPNARIPVLVKLRRCTGTIEGLIRDFLVGHQVALEIAQIEELLRQGRFLLLLDGLNELPKAFETEVANFRDRYRRTTPMIVSTRDLGGGNTLGIEKTLKMLPLTEPQMREFVRGYLVEKGDRLFQNLQGDRLRKFAETPLLLWMLCRVFAHNGKVPDNLGFAFREFAQLYDQKLQADVPADSRDQWHRLLRHLAFVMMQGKTAIDLELSIPREEAEDCLTAYLRQEGWSNPRECAERWLQDLLKYHLIQPVIQPNFEEHIEFRHQLIQEYYAAEALLVQLPNLTNKHLQSEYLNYLKWTEPVALMLALVADKGQAVRLVQQALVVDLRLAARLSGEVRAVFQASTVDIIQQHYAAVECPSWLLVDFFDQSRSEAVIESLLNVLQHADESVRMNAARTLGKIGSEAAIAGLLQALLDSSHHVRTNAARALGKIGSEAAITGLVQALYENNDLGIAELGVAEALVSDGSEAAIAGLVQALADLSHYKRIKIAVALGKIDSEATLLKALADLSHYERMTVATALGNIGSEALSKIDSEATLLKALADSSHHVRMTAATALGNIGSEAAIVGLLQLLSDSDRDVRRRAISALGKIGSEAALLKALADSPRDVRESAAMALGNIGSEAAITGLLQALADSDRDVRWRAVSALGKIGSEAAIVGLLQALASAAVRVRRSAATALGNIGSEAAIPGLLQALADSDRDVRLNAAEALGNIGSEAGIPTLLQALADENNNVRQRSTRALGNISSEAAIAGLLQALADADKYVRKIATEALGNISSDVAITGLLQALADSDGDVRKIATEALVNIGSDAAIAGLLQVLADSSHHVRMTAATALVNIGSDAAIAGLLQALADADKYVRLNAAEALVNIGSEVAIAGLLQALADADRNVRQRAAKALSKIGSEQAIIGLLNALQDADWDVRKSAVEALGKIGSGQAIMGLLNVLHTDYSMRWITAEALGQIAKSQSEALAPHLPHLLTLIPTKSGESAYRVILAIQENCKFYNYGLWQAHLTVQNADRPQSQNSAPNAITIQTLERLTIMTGKAPIFNQQHATIGVNYAAEGSTIEFTQHTSSSEQTFEILLTDYQQFIEQLQQKYSTLADSTTVPQIIEVEAKLIETQDQQRGQNFLNLKRLWNGGKKASIKVGEHFAENNVWAKGAIAFLEGVSEDAK